MTDPIEERIKLFHSLNLDEYGEAPINGEALRQCLLAEIKFLRENPPFASTGRINRDRTGGWQSAIDTLRQMLGGG